MREFGAAVRRANLAAVRFARALTEFERPTNARVSYETGRGFRVERVWRTRPGYWGLVVMQPIGFRNGYVQVPDDHLWNGVGYDDLDVDVHGGLTFSGNRSADEFANGDEVDGVPPGWYIGFDCAHWPDAPDPEIYAALIGNADVAASTNAAFGDGHVWTVDEVVDEVEHLAAQVARAA